MNYFLGCCLSTLLVAPCYCDSSNSTLPANVVKITKENNPKCVEFITYKKEMYCSLAPLDNSSVDPQVLSYEKGVVKFDDRPWKAAWGQKTADISTVEYIPLGDDINNWHELVTTQFMPNLSHVTPNQFQKTFLDGLDKAGITYTVHSVEEEPNQLIFEFKVQKPENLQQDELLKIKKGADGMYILHYAIKNPDMSQENRRKWIENLKNSTFK